MGTRAVGLAADPRDTDAVTELLEEVVRALDRLDVLVHVLARVGSIARDLAPFGIRANLVIPHPVHERRVGANGGTAGMADDDTGANRAELEPLELLDAASAIAFLASDRATHVTGQSIHAGGRVRY
jgi:NAD(P)-dependent dehydrogenase (short-subunit alcohol dehydrogenase family)